MLSFHNVVARYIWLVEGVLPARWGTIGSSIGGVPIGGSIVQSTAAATIITCSSRSMLIPSPSYSRCCRGRRNRVLLLMIGASMSVIWYYRAHNRPSDGNGSARARSGPRRARRYPGDALLNVNALTGSVADVQWLLPGIVAAAAAIGAG